MPTTQPGLGYKGSILFAGEEATWGTEVVRTDGTCLTGGGITVEEEVMESENINATFKDIDESYRGKITVSGDPTFEPRYEGSELIYKHAFGAVSTAEVATFEVTTSNKYFDFNIGAAELNATVAEGTYAMGADNTVVGSLCEAVYDAIVAAEAVGVYTVTFNTSTKIITITRSTGSLDILWKTGVHGSDNSDDHIGTLLGYSDVADDSGSLSYAADNAIVSVYDHTFIIPNDSVALLEGLTLEQLMDGGLTTGKAYILTGTKINSIDFSVESGGLMTCSLNIIAKEKILEETVTSVALSTKPLIQAKDSVFTYDGGAEAKVTSFSFTLGNSLMEDRLFLGSNNIGQPIPGDKKEVTGSFTVEYEDASKWTDFRDNTTKDINLKFTSAVAIKTGFYYDLEFDFNQIKLQGGDPSINDEGVETQEIPFKAYAADGDNREVIMIMRNTKVAVA